MSSRTRPPTRRRAPHRGAWALAAALALPAGLLAAPQAGAAPVAAGATASHAAKPMSRAAKLAALQRSLRAKFTSYAGAEPASANPALALVPPGTRLDYQGWAAQAARLSAARERSREHRASGALGPVPGLTYSEQEGPDERGFNDDAATAELISGFGTGAGDEPAATILGVMNPASPSSYRSVKANKENDSGPGRARDLGVSNKVKAVKVPGYRGDAPGSGDQRKDDDDWYQLHLKAGQQLQAQVTTTGGNLKPAMALIDEDFNFVADTFPQFGKTAKINTSIQADKDYYLIVFGWWVFGAPPNGPTTGDYSLKVGAAKGDPDTFAVDLEAGDVIAASTNAKGWVNVFGPSDSNESHASNQDASFIFPLASPLPGAHGLGLSEVVARETGRYYVQYSGGDGPYVGRLEVYRHGFDESGETARVYLDFDGARLNTGPWGGWGVSDLSPLSKFMPKWGLDRSQEADLIAAIKANVTENVEADLAASGISGSVDVEVTTSLDGPDITGEPGVTTIVVGGSIEESGVPTIGIAASIDPGNYERSETGMVLLDVLSDTSGDYGNASLNYFIKPESDRLAFVAQGIGNVTSHEVGHMLGNWHTDNGDSTSSLMDAGGQGFGRLFGVGPDRIGGTADDADVDFVVDTFIPGEGFLGREDTQTRSTFAMSN